MTATKNTVNAPLPAMRVDTPLLDPQDGHMTPRWKQWITMLRSAVVQLQQTTPTVVVVTDENYTAEPGDIVVCDPSGGSITVTLPPTTGSQRKLVDVVQENIATANTVTVVPDDPSDETINREASFELVQGEGITCRLVPDESRWIVK